jgi:hypothetical protein
MHVCVCVCVYVDTFACMHVCVCVCVGEKSERTDVMMWVMDGWMGVADSTTTRATTRQTDRQTDRQRKRAKRWVGLADRVHAQLSLKRRRRSRKGRRDTGRPSHSTRGRGRRSRNTANR